MTAPMPKLGDLVLTVKQPWADLIMVGEKDVENRSWPVPSTLPQWMRCDRCGRRSREGVPETIPVTKDGRRGTSVHWHDVCLPQFDSVGELRADGPFPFRLWIHAGVLLDPAGQKRCFCADCMHRLDRAQFPALLRREHSTGGLIASVEVTDCHHADEHADESAPFPYLVDTDHGWQCSTFAEPDRFHWTLADPDPLDAPILMRGRQRLWRISKADLVVTR